MNLQYLFEIQAGLDRHIEDKHPRKEGGDRLAKKILALQVELGELANEWRGFKFWKINQQPVTYKREHVRRVKKGLESFENHEGAWETIVVESNPLLEEYVDCLHFILSIGLEIKCTSIACDLSKKVADSEITTQFIGLFDIVHAVYHNYKFQKGIKTESLRALFNCYHQLLMIFKGLGEMLGFTEEQIEEAYLEKNKVNHERQVNGY